LEGRRKLELGNIVPCVFALVLALKLVPAIKPRYLTDMSTVGSLRRIKDQEVAEG